MESNSNSEPRKYRRRSAEEKIADLERRISEIKAKQQAKETKSNPIFKEIPKIQRRLRKFVQFATDHDRPDIANSTMAFNAGLERILRSEAQRVSAAEPDEEPAATE